MKHLKLFENFKNTEIIKEGIKAISAEEAKVYFDQSKYVLHEGNTPGVLIIRKAGTPNNFNSPKEGILYTPENKSYAKWSSSQKGEGAYAIET